MAADVGTIVGYVFINPDQNDAPFGSDAIQLCVGGVVLARVPAPAGAPALDPGQFRVLDTTTISFRLPAGTVAGQPVSVRLFVVGAESPVQWITP
jgi:hypothetical protein